MEPIESITYYPITEIQTQDTNTTLEMVLGYLLHGEFLQMSYVEYCDAFTSRQQRTMELQRFFETSVL